MLVVPLCLKRNPIVNEIPKSPEWRNKCCVEVLDGADGKAISNSWQLNA